jgi:photosystem II stability/assembly factor-like uncharacterized protein
MNDVHFINKNDGIAGTGNIPPPGPPGHHDPYGYLHITNDGGKTWQKSLNHPAEYISSCSFLNDHIGFTLVMDFYWKDFIYKTADSGANWSVVYESNYDSLGYDFSGNDIDFINERIGWAVGGGNWSEDSSGGIIIETNDAGEKWDLVWKLPDNDRSSNELNAVHVLGGEAWAVGESGLIVKYTEQDQWQRIVGVTDLPLRKVFFSDKEHGWISGGYFDEDNVQLILLKTNDGGENWQEKAINFQINDMFFEDSLHGMAVGCDTDEKGIVIEIWDGGANWTTQVEGLSAPLNALYFKDGYGWAVGGDGLVLRTDDGLNWIDQNISKIYPSKLSLSQNYPNPFNPATAIGYQLSAVSDVEISIYNLLGQKIVTLVKEQQNAGYHQVQWDATGFASGLYYYRLSTSSGFVQTRKLVLIK